MSDIIRQLPDSVANQIAAGEVIQRPASVIKELVENSVDAGASQITIVLKDAGRTLIQVIDNGTGMSETDARRAFERHATSKIKDAADLFELHTMGFRGEALASVAAVAQVDMRTMKAGESIGTRILINGSEIESQMPEACPQGTNLMVKNLFFNVPARRKFLKKDSVELSHIMREFERLALVNCDKDLTLVSNDSTSFALRKAPLLKRIADLFGKPVERQLIPVETDTSIVRIDGYVGLPEYARKRSPLQYLTVNGRNMQHPYFKKAILSCYEHLIPSDHQPVFFLNFTVDPDTIDVNIHPTKSEIKFENEQGIWQILMAAVREALGRYNAGPAIDFDRDDAPELPSFSPDSKVRFDERHDTSYNPFKADTAPRRSSVPTDWEKLYENFNAKRNDVLSSRGSAINDELDNFSKAIPATLQGELNLDFKLSQANVMQVKNRYILTPSHDGLLIVDQHRAHKHILYNRYLKMPLKEENASQKLIFPEVLNLTPSQNAIMETLACEIENMGFVVTYVGDNSWGIHGSPAVMADVNPKDALLAIIDDAAEFGENLSSRLHESVALAMANAAAIKSGQPLTRDEMDRIVAELMKLPAPAFTVDGLKTFALLSLDEISKLF